MKRQIILVIATFLVTMVSGGVEAQDGKALFKQHCSSCHKPDKSGVGPALRNIREKWEKNADNPELIYDWVKNWRDAVELGDPYVSSLPNTFPGEMNPMDVTNEEIDAIFDYVDAYDEAAETAAAKAASGGGGGTAEEVPTISNYSQNLNILIVSLIVMSVFAITIMVQMSTVRSLLQSDMYQRKMAERHAKMKEAAKKVGILLALILPSAAFAQEAVEPIVENPSETFFQITDTHIWIVTTINLVLFGVILYFKHLQDQILEMIGMKSKRARFFRKRKLTFRNVFTRSVRIEEEKDILMDHEYDGIRELDNILPPWWLWLFYGTVIFAVFHIFHYHILDTGDLQYEAYEKEMVEAQIEVDAWLEKQNMNMTAADVVLLTGAGDISNGRSLFMKECAKCHGERGEGGTGANLTDDYWIYGNRIGDVFRTISEGGNNGMESWKNRFNPKEIQLMASFILSIDEEITVDMGGKAPEPHANLMADAALASDTATVDTVSVDLPVIDSLQVMQDTVLMDTLQ